MSSPFASALLYLAVRAVQFSIIFTVFFGIVAMLLY